MNPYGLPNNGNLCYMNTALQTIFCIYGDLFISGKCKKNEKVNKFLKRFTYLVDVIENRDGKWSKKYVNKYLQYFLKHLEKVDKFKRFMTYRQEDSYDFLVEILDLLSSYLQYEVSIDISLKINEKDLDDIDKSRLVYYKYIQENLKYTSEIEDSIRGYFKASLICQHSDCLNKCEKFESFLTLSLPIEGFNKLEECLQNYVKPILLDEENQWCCNKCNRKSSAEKKLSIWNTSDYLIISYKRYSNILDRSVKDNHSILSPFSLDLSPYVEDNQTGNLYSLCSFTIHIGSMSRGHYKMARIINNEWFIFNDKKVSRVKESNIDTQYAYYLVYKRK